MKEQRDHSKNIVHSWDFDKCVQILKQEIELLDKIIDVQYEIRTSVVVREWENFDEFMNTLNTYNNDFEALETERDQVFSSIAVEKNRDILAEESFYAVTARLPVFQRQTLTDLYRDLKIRILRVRFENDGLMKYLNEAKSYTETFLDTVFPGRRGKLYSAKGTIVASDMRSMILNHSL